MDKQVCGRCFVKLGVDKFKLKRDGKRQKRCTECNEKSKGYQQSRHCRHGNNPSSCVECDGENICPHKKYRNYCVECNGSGMCPHKKERYRCKECDGASICPHKKVRSVCIECDGASICPHKRRRAHCKECDGNYICLHKIMRNTCKECDGASICQHGRLHYVCIECDGASICEHKIQRKQCKICDLGGYLRSTISSRLYQCLKHDKELHTLEYIGASIDTIKEHLESKFDDEMTWENHGKWHMDHIIPLKYDDPSLDEQIKRLHYTNLQPMWASENIAKGNRHCG